FIFALLLLGYNLRHSPVRLQFPFWLRWVFISPADHQVHHSADPAHYHSNFGFMFSCWDRLFGTYQYLSAEQELKFGLGPESAKYQSLAELTLRPFWAILLRILRGGLPL